MNGEHKMPVYWQEKHKRATVSAGPVSWQAQSPFIFSLGLVRYNEIEAQSDADAMDAIFSQCPPHQRGIAAQAMQAVK